MEFTKALMVLFALIFVSCVPADATNPAAAPTPTPTSGQPSPAYDLSKYAFPGLVDPTIKYLFYIHGRIIEEQGIPAVDPRYGAYEYEAIMKKLSGYGLRVISEQRAKNTDGAAYAKRIAAQVADLLDAGVPAANITVVGASKGGWITVYASHLLENQDIKFVIMAICNPEVLEGFKQDQIFLYGKVLSIYDTADIEYGGSCEEFFSLSEGHGGLSRHDEIVLKIGTGHGILYKPLDEWILPVVQWAGEP